MAETSGSKSGRESQDIDASGIGCFAGCAATIAVPTVVFCGILIASRMNPDCGTPADAGGCEMGLASGTISAIVVGLGLGILVAVITTVAIRASRRRARHTVDR